MQQINGRQYDRDGGKNPDAVEKARQAYEKFERLHPQLPMVRNTHRHDAHSRYCGRRRIENCPICQIIKATSGKIINHQSEALKTPTADKRITIWHPYADHERLAEAATVGHNLGIKIVWAPRADSWYNPSHSTTVFIAEASLIDEWIDQEYACSPGEPRQTI